jgi:hypothetical protein
MIAHTSRIGLSVGIFMLGWVLFSNPVLALFNYKILVWGVPLLFLYIFSAWLLLILLVIGVTKARPRTTPAHNSRDVEDLDEP